MIQSKLKKFHVDRRCLTVVLSYWTGRTAWKEVFVKCPTCSVYAMLECESCTRTRTQDESRVLHIQQDQSAISVVDRHPEHRCKLSHAANRAANRAADIGITCQP